ncbi:MAG: hypothetical protein U0640_15195 [Phycisphaerales bacterium]
MLNIITRPPRNATTLVASFAYFAIVQAASAQVPVISLGPRPFSGGYVSLSGDGSTVINTRLNATSVAGWYHRDGVWRTIQAPAGSLAAVESVTKDGVHFIGRIAGTQQDTTIPAVWWPETGWIPVSSDPRVEISFGGSSEHGLELLATIRHTDFFERTRFYFAQGQYVVDNRPGRSVSPFSVVYDQDLSAWSGMSSDGSRALEFNGSFLQDGISLVYPSSESINVGRPNGLIPFGGTEESSGRISGNGRVVYGDYSYNGPQMGGGYINVSGAFRWEQDVGNVFLSYPPSGDVIKISFDGNLVLTSTGIYDYLAQTNQPTLTYLQDNGADFTGWSSITIADISSDFRTFVGTGTFAGSTQVWKVTIPSTPTLSVLVVVVTAACRRRRA